MQKLAFLSSILLLFAAAAEASSCSTFDYMSCTSSTKECVVDNTVPTGLVCTTCDTITSESACLSGATSNRCGWQDGVCLYKQNYCTTHYQSTSQCLPSDNCHFVGGMCKQVCETIGTNVYGCVAGNGCPWDYSNGVCTNCTKLDASTCGNVYSEVCHLEWSGCKDGSCNAIAGTSQSSCRALGCGWTGSTCQQCFQFLQSRTGCEAAAPNCVFDSSEAICSAVQPSLPAPTTPTSSGGCSTHTDRTSCELGKTSVGSSCIWDLWLLQCFDTNAQKNAVKPCSYWSSVATSPDVACANHGCTYAGTTCYGQVAGQNGTDYSNVIYSEETVSFVDPVFIPNTDTFGFHVLVPFEVPTTSNYWWVITIGSDTIGTDSNPIRAGPCSSLGQTGVIPISYSFPDTAGLTEEARRWIQFSNSFNFTNYPNGINSSVSGSSYDYKSALSASFGPFVSGSNSFVKTVSQTSDNLNTDFFVSISLSAAAAQCPGVRSSSDATNTYFNLPVRVFKYFADGGQTSISTSFPIVKDNSGSMILNPTSPYLKSVIRQDARVVQGSCATPQEGQLFITYKVTFKGVSDPTAWIGPRDMSDLFVHPPYLLASTVTNGYADQFVPGSYKRLGCNPSTFLCSLTVQTVSECRRLQKNGQAFNSEDYANPVNRILAMNGDYPYPSGLDGQHNWYMNVRSCPRQNPITNDPPSDAICTLLNMSPLGYPDPVLVSIFLNSYPPEDTLTFSFEVALGLLPTPSSSLSEMIVLADKPARNGTSELPPSFSLSPGDRTDQISWRRSICPTIRLVDSLLNEVDLRFGVGDGNITFTATTAIGDEVLYNSAPMTLDYLQLFPLMDFVPKNTLSHCPDCPLAPLVAQQALLGGDTFCVSTTSLMQAWPLPFQGVKMKLTFFDGSMPYVDSNGQLVVSRAGGGRNLLGVTAQLGSGTITYNADGSVTYVTSVYVITDGMPIYDPHLSFYNSTSNTTITVPITSGSGASATPVTVLSGGTIDNRPVITMTIAPESFDLDGTQLFLQFIGILSISIFVFILTQLTMNAIGAKPSQR